MKNNTENRPLCSIVKSGKNYVGKGPVGRMIQSALEKTARYGDDVAAMMWKPAKDKASAFIGEYLLQTAQGVLSANKNANTYNKIWSPGKKLFWELFK